MSKRNLPELEVSAPERSSSRKPRFSFSDLPINYRLPISIGLLLFAIFALSAFASYRAVRDSALDVGRERLHSVTELLATLLEQQGTNMGTRTATAANDSVLRAFLRSPSPATRAAAVAALQRLGLAQDQSHLRVELWDVNQSPALTIPEDAPAESADLISEFKQAGADPFKAVGAIRSLQNTLAFPIVAAVKDEAGKPIGFLVRWRRLSATPEARKQLTDIVGNDAVLYLGNIAEDVWTDMVKVVPKPPVALSSTLEVTNYARNGNSVMALGRPIRGTPWFVVVEFPAQPLLAQASRLLRRIAVVGLVLLALGITSTILLSRNITRPLRSLTAAATAISAGDYSRTVDIRRDDELGELARAFNKMVITARESQAELERKIQERTLQLEAAPWAMLMVDGNDRMTLVNRQAEQLFGYERGELLEQPVEMLVPARYRSTHPGHRTAFAENPAPRAMGARPDLYGLRKDGSEVPIEIGLTPIKTDKGAFVLASIADTSERKQAEERFRLVVEAAPSAMIMVDDRGCMTLINNQTETLFQYKREELIDQPIEMLVPERYRAAHPDHRSAFLKKPTARPMGAGRDLYGRRKNGSEIPIEIGLNPIETSQGTFILASIIDITERKRTEENLERQASLFDQTYDAVIVWDWSGAITFWNRGAERLYGFGRKEALGKLPSELLSTQTNVATEDLLRALEMESEWEGELKQVTRDGKEIIVESRMVVVREPNRSYVLETNRDISERKQDEENLRAKIEELASMTQQLWQASKLATMGELAASVAHELNNPLATVALRLDSLADQLGDDPPKLRVIKIVNGEVERMAKLVGRLLQFGRRGHPQISTLDVREELINSLELTDYHLRSQKIEVTREFEAAVPMILADCQQLRQVFLNLLTNASDAMPDGGKLNVRVSFQEANGEYGKVRIELADTGLGVSAANLERIWEPFFTTKPEGKGTGLGLAICRRVVEEHQGTISLQSGVGEGTKVTILFPATTGAEADVDTNGSGRLPSLETIKLRAAPAKVRI